MREGEAEGTWGTCGNPCPGRVSHERGGCLGGLQPPPRPDLAVGQLLLSLILISLPRGCY